MADPLRIDLIGGPGPEVIVEKTNGHEVFISLRLIGKIGGVLLSTLAGLWYLL
jgi:hypothetical protein